MQKVKITLTINTNKPQLEMYRKSTEETREMALRTLVGERLNNC